MCKHGIEYLRRNGTKGNRTVCGKCETERVVERRRRIKKQLMDAAGGCCAICGYDRTPRALHFHHLDPSEKTYSISRWIYLGAERLQAEADKCILLCSNCHAEVEDGIINLADVHPPSDTRLKG